jgi:hypothetical protein
LASQLQAETPAFERHHGRRAPGSAELLAAPACHHAAPVTTPEPDCKLHNRGQNDDTLRLVQKVRRKIVGNIEDFDHHLAGILNAVVFIFLGKRRLADKDHYSH